jgi:hypothetical protein
MLEREHLRTQKESESEARNKFASELVSHSARERVSEWGALRVKRELTIFKNSLKMRQFGNVIVIYYAMVSVNVLENVHSPFGIPLARDDFQALPPRYTAVYSRRKGITPKVRQNCWQATEPCSTHARFLQGMIFRRNIKRNSRVWPEH